MKLPQDLLAPRLPPKVARLRVLRLFMPRAAALKALGIPGASAMSWKVAPAPMARVSPVRATARGRSRPMSRTEAGLSRKSPARRKVPPASQAAPGSACLAASASARLEGRV